MGTQNQSFFPSLNPLCWPPGLFFCSLSPSVGTPDFRAWIRIVPCKHTRLASRVATVGGERGVEAWTRVGLAYPPSAPHNHTRFTPESNTVLSMSCVHNRENNNPTLGERSFFSSEGHQLFLVETRWQSTRDVCRMLVLQGPPTANVFFLPLAATPRGLLRTETNKYVWFRCPFTCWRPVHLKRMQCSSRRCLSCTTTHMKSDRNAQTLREEKSVPCLIISNCACV